MKNLIFLLPLLFTFSSFITHAQPDYNDVAVIVNTNSPTSMRIGDYFQQQRNIPEINMVRIAAPTSEEIDTLELKSVVQQIDTYLSSNQIKDQINYLVTTKGLPLTVTADQCVSIDDISHCSSFDAELTLLRGALANEIGQRGGINNPYYNAQQHFSSSDFDIYLVTRLDGYTESDIFDLIDRSGPNIVIEQSSTELVLDISHLAMSDGAFGLFDRDFMELNNKLISDGWSTTYHPDTSLLMDQQNVLVLNSINYSPFNETPNHSWTRGSIATLLFSRTASTFDENQNTDNRILLAGLIAEGATGGFGSSFLNYYSESPIGDILYAAYLNPDSSYNLAESYFLASRRLSIGSVIIGDPKTSLDVDFVNSTITPPLSSSIKLFPNPNQGIFEIQTGEETVEQIQIFNAVGQRVFTQNADFNKGMITLNLGAIPNGVYLVEIDTEQGKLSKKVVIKQ